MGREARRQKTEAETAARRRKAEEDGLARLRQSLGTVATIAREIGCSAQSANRSLPPGQERDLAT